MFKKKHFARDLNSMDEKIYDLSNIINSTQRKKDRLDEDIVELSKEREKLRTQACLKASQRGISFKQTDEWKEMQNKSHKLQGLYRKRAEFNTQLEDLDLEKVTIMIDGLSLGNEDDLFKF